MFQGDSSWILFASKGLVNVKVKVLASSVSSIANEGRKLQAFLRLFLTVIFETECKEMTRPTSVQGESLLETSGLGDSRGGFSVQSRASVWVISLSKSF